LVEHGKEAQSRPPKPKPGRKPDTLKIEGDWQDAEKNSFQKKKPAGGWPKETTRSRALRRS